MQKYQKDAIIAAHATFAWPQTPDPDVAAQSFHRVRTTDPFHPSSGKLVAVLVQESLGAGWTTSMDLTDKDTPEFYYFAKKVAMHHPVIVYHAMRQQELIGGSRREIRLNAEAARDALQKLTGLDDVWLPSCWYTMAIPWVPEKTRFTIISVGDGRERLVKLTDLDHTA